MRETDIYALFAQDTGQNLIKLNQTTRFTVALFLSDRINAHVLGHLVRGACIVPHARKGGRALWRANTACRRRPTIRAESENRRRHVGLSRQAAKHEISFSLHLAQSSLSRKVRQRTRLWRQHRYQFLHPQNIARSK